MSENESFSSCDFTIRQRDGRTRVDLSRVKFGQNKAHRGPAR
jgi:hypothetical protein